MANAHALEENTRDVIDPLISNNEACAISISTSYGSGPDQTFLDSPKAEWLPLGGSGGNHSAWPWLPQRRFGNCSVVTFAAVQIELEDLR